MGNAADMNQDGKLSYKEFVHFICGSSSGAKMALDKCAYAPHLHKFFMLIKEDADNSTKDMADFLLTGDVCKVVEAEQSIIQQAQQHLIDSFDNHDKDESGNLSKAEAATLFSNVMAEAGCFEEFAAAVTIKKSLQMMMTFLCGLDEDKKQEAMKKHNAAHTARMNAINEKVAGQVLAYKSRKAERDAAAFKVMSRGDGCLDLKDFMEAMSPGSERNERFLAALGIEP